MRAGSWRALVPGLVLACLALGPRTSTAQSGRAEITGEVRDDAGAVVPNCQVTVTEVATNIAVVVVTGPEGVFNVPYLRPGVYRIAAEAPSFRSSIREGVELATGERVRIDLTLAVGAFTEATTVIADASLLQTESSGLGEVIPNRSVVQLPLNGRSYLPLVALVPGVAFPPGAAFPRLNGGRPRVNEYLYDGISVLQPEPGHRPVPADHRRHPGVQVSSPTRRPPSSAASTAASSTSARRPGATSSTASAFEFLRNEALNARNLFAPRTAANPDKPDFRRNQFGFVLGGPIAEGPDVLLRRLPGHAARHRPRAHLDGAHRPAAPGDLHRAGRRTRARHLRSRHHAARRRGRRHHARSVSRQRHPRRPHRPGGRRRSSLAIRCPTCAGTANNYRRVGERGRRPGPVRRPPGPPRLEPATSSSPASAISATSPIPSRPLPDGSGTLTTGAIGPTDTRAPGRGAQLRPRVRRHAPSTTCASATRGARSAARACSWTGRRPQALGLPGIPTNAAYDNALPTFTIDGFQQLGSSREHELRLHDWRDPARGLPLRAAGTSLAQGRLRLPDGAARHRPAAVPHGRLPLHEPGDRPAGHARARASPCASFLLGQVQNFAIDLQASEFRERARVLELFVQDDWRRHLAAHRQRRPALHLELPVDRRRATRARSSTSTTRSSSTRARTATRAPPASCTGTTWGPASGLAYAARQPKTVVRSGYALVWIEQAGITTPVHPAAVPVPAERDPALARRHPARVRPRAGAFRGAHRAHARRRPRPERLRRDPRPGLGLRAAVEPRGPARARGRTSRWRSPTPDRRGPTSASPTRTSTSSPSSSSPRATPSSRACPTPASARSRRRRRWPRPTVPRAQVLRPFPCFNTVSLYRNNVGNTSYNALAGQAREALRPRPLRAS